VAWGHFEGRLAAFLPTRVWLFIEIPPGLVDASSRFHAFAVV
jgi:hypothetical protein